MDGKPQRLPGAANLSEPTPIHCSSFCADLLYAEQVAFNYIVAHYPAGGQVSNGWQGGEFAGQIANDSFFADFNYNWTNEYRLRSLPSPLLVTAASESDIPAPIPG